VHRRGLRNSRGWIFNVIVMSEARLPVPTMPASSCVISGRVQREPPQR
jgi:hypothetical protein